MQTVRSNDGAALWASTARVATNPNATSQTQTMTAGAIAATKEHSELVAAAQATERWAASLVDRSKITTGSWNDLSDHALHPDAIVSYLPWQHTLETGLVAFDPSQVRLWVQCHRVDEEPLLVLADLVFYGMTTQPTLVHHSATSSGMAAHTTRSEAIELAWRELVERDAFLRWWYGRRRALAVAPRETTTMTQQVVTNLAQMGWQIRWYSLGTDRRPVVLAVAFNDHEVTLGCACAPLATAIEKSAREAWAIAATGASPGETIPAHEVRTPRQHGDYYRTSHGLDVLRRRLDFDNPTFVDVGDFQDPEPAPASAVVYEWDETETAPFVVVRVIDPDLIPITFGYGRDPLGRQDVSAMLERVDMSTSRPLPPHPFA